MPFSVDLTRNGLFFHCHFPKKILKLLYEIIINRLIFEDQSCSVLNRTRMFAVVSN